MKKYLNNGWSFTSVNKHLDMIKRENYVWAHIDVPGDINWALKLNKVVSDPFYDTNARELYFVSANEWWYYKKFTHTKNDANYNIVFDGIDGTADVYLNNNWLFKATDSFIPYKHDVSELLNDGENEILVRFYAIDDLLESKRFSGQTGFGKRRAFLRKPQYNFGWDWAVPVPSLGIWKEVYLEEILPELTNIGIKTNLSGLIDFSFEVDEKTRLLSYEIKVNVFGHNEEHENLIEVSKKQKSYTFIKIEKPKLWYPSGYGPQNLYDYHVSLIIEGKEAFIKQGRFGIREVKILEEPFVNTDERGYSFWIMVNGMRTYSKGGNWIPLELWPGIIDKTKYKKALLKAKEASFSMLRVWGGGIYEDDEFYNLCDELGIMVWQDFMFAGAGVPLNLLKKEIINEVTYQILRLRNHPCIAIYCGCNEDCFSWSDGKTYLESMQADIIDAKDLDKWEVNRFKEDVELYTMLIRGLVSKLGFDVPYVESSPQAKDGTGNNPNSGNSHVSCWKYALFETNGNYENYRKHFDKVCSFDSEFCIEGPAHKEYMQSFLAPENFWPPSEAWIYHLARGHADLPHFEQTMRLAGATFGEIDSLDKYCKYGMAMHAEHMRSEFDSARHDYPNNGGTMMWMFLDCWPTANWAIINYDMSLKPAYYAAKRGCKNILPIIFERKGIIDFSISNHTLKKLECEAEYGIMKLNGLLITDFKKKFIVKKFETVNFARFLKEELHCEDDEFVFLKTKVNNQELDSIAYFTEYFKRMKFTPSKLNYNISSSQKVEDGYKTTILLENKDYTRFAYVNIKNKRDVAFSDNYFDLLPNSKKIITCVTENKLEFSDLEVGDFFTNWK